MACVTYLSDHEIAHWKLEDSHLRSLLDELNQVEGECWAVQPFRYRDRWWSKERRLYIVYSHVEGSEWQIINFPPHEGSDWGINHAVDLRLVQTWLLAYLAGLDIKKKAKVA